MLSVAVCRSLLKFYDLSVCYDVVVASVSADAEVTIEGPAPADIVKKEVHNGVLTIDYLPVIPGEYLVNVKSHGKHIHGSPFSARISGLFDCGLIRDARTI